jgi:hypothetical protein
MEASRTPHSDGAKRAHRFVVPALLAVATIVWLAAAVSVWVNRQALNTDNWTKTSSRLLANEKIDAAVGGYLVNELFTGVDVAGSIEAKLPKQLKAASGPAAAALRSLADRAAPRLLESGQVRDLWVLSNRAAHRQLVRVIEGREGSAVSTEAGVVTLDLHRLVDQLASRLGIEDQVTAVRSKVQESGKADAARAAAEGRLGVTLPPKSGKLVIMKSEQLKTAQDVGDAIKGLALVLPILALLLFAAALALARGWRRRALRTVGWCVVAVGLLLLLVRRSAGNHIVDSLVALPSNRPAAHEAWDIATTLLRSIGVALTVYGVLIVLSAWLAGPTRWAVSARRRLAPSLRDHPGAAYAAVGGVLLLVVVWGPTPAFRQLAWIALFAALLAVGVTALRRQTAVEFAGIPDGATGGERAGARPGKNGGSLDELERLAELHDRGALTDEEFAAQKSHVVNGA